ncbi:hypothetical protein ES703_86928 [subsurface metagenome]
MQWFIDMIVAICNAYTDQAILDAKVIPSGTIILWHGEREDIPDGWLPCDGSHDTPDLRGRFMRCAGGGYPVDDTGGTENHEHGAGIGLNAGKGNTKFANHVPPYWNMWYIKKS